MKLQRYVKTAEFSKIIGSSVYRLQKLRNSKEEYNYIRLNDTTILYDLKGLPEHYEGPADFKGLLLSSTEASYYMGIHKRTLPQWRYLNISPDYIKKEGRTYYYKDTIDEYMLKHKVLIK